jgi:molybdopterin synthase catalytic subunit
MIRVQLEDFDIGAELAQLSEGNHAVGGIASFIGLVRDMSPTADSAGNVSAMTLEHYPGMTEKQLAAIEAEARRRWPIADCLIIHRHGRLLPGDRIVLVATAAAHRQAALDSCAFLIDWLKTKAPFWKLEDGPAGSQWVEAKASDDQAAERWKTNRSG